MTEPGETLLQDFLETVRYDEADEWRGDPELDEDDDDEPGDDTTDLD